MHVYFQNFWSIQFREDFTRYWLAKSIYSAITNEKQKFNHPRTKEFKVMAPTVYQDHNNMVPQPHIIQSKQS